MKIQKRLSRLFAFALVLALMTALAVPGVAETGSTTVSGGELANIVNGLNHGRQLGCNSTGTYVLNQYTNATVTLSNTVVTTWKDTRQPSQFWEIGSTDSGTNVYCALDNNSFLFLRLRHATSRLYAKRLS